MSDDAPDTQSVSARAIDRMVYNDKPYVPPYFDGDDRPSFHKIKYYIEQFVRDEFFAGAVEIIEAYGVKTFREPVQLKELYVLGLRISMMLSSNFSPHEPISDDEREYLLGITEFYAVQLFCEIRREHYANEEDLSVIIRHIMRWPENKEVALDLLEFYKKRFGESNQYLELENEAKIVFKETR